MTINYQKTIQLNTDIISYKQTIGVISLLLIPSKKILILIANLVKRVLFNRLDKLLKLLKENQDIFQDEYYDCLDINDMIKYTLKRENSLITPDDLKCISDIHNSFFDLILFKLNSLKNNNCEFNESFYDEFEPKYDSFNTDLMKFKEYFYCNIYQESFDKQDVVDYLNVAWE